ncbi:MAG: adenylyl-sulfate kinase [Deltaproteobacteria bacterium]|nr:adenylyl-sulfate kinase [Deltaproteobacteria bacterium]
MGFCLWLTGLPGSGKSTIVHELFQALSALGVKAVILSLDHMRKVLTPEPKYTDQERSLLYRSLALTAQLLVEHGGNNVIIDATGNRREFRDLARRLIPEFAEIYVKCPLETCKFREAARRDHPVQKDLYRSAAQGKLTGGLPGISAPYEEPENPEVLVQSDVLSPQESAESIMAYIQSRWPREARAKS